VRRGFVADDGCDPFAGIALDIALGGQPITLGSLDWDASITVGHPGFDVAVCEGRTLRPDQCRAADDGPGLARTDLTAGPVTAGERRSGPGSLLQERHVPRDHRAMLDQ
jgi:hypothetical protein